MQQRYTGIQSLRTGKFYLTHPLLLMSRGTMTMVRAHGCTQVILHSSKVASTPANTEGARGTIGPFRYSQVMYAEPRNNGRAT